MTMFHALPTIDPISIATSTKLPEIDIYIYASRLSVFNKLLVQVQRAR